VFKFIHTSDWHIGRLFQNISLLDDQLFVLEQIKQYAVDHQVDALVIAGDIFDRSIPPVDAVDALDQFVGSFISDTHIPIVMISGNHDSATRIRFGASLASGAGFHMIASLNRCLEPVVIHGKRGSAAFYGIPFHEPVEVREAFGEDTKTYDEAHTFLVESIKQQLNHKQPNILISHCFVAGAQASDSERKLSVGGSESVSYEPMLDFDYVALGHLHGPQYRGAQHVRYSGSPLKYSFSESGHNKSVTLVEVGEGGATHTQLPLHAKRDLRILTGSLDELLTQAANDPNKDDFILARLTDEQDLLDPMRRLRDQYPNIVEMERINYIKHSGSQLVADVGKMRSEMDIFQDFFTQVTGSELTTEQSELIASVIQQANKSLEERS